MSAERALETKTGIPLSWASFEVNGERAKCAIAGEGRPMVLVHGLNMGWGEWHNMIAELAKTKKVYALDLSHSVEAAAKSGRFQARSVLEALDTSLRKLELSNAMVLGHSLGAWLALKLAAERHPSVGSVIAMNAIGFIDYVPWRFRALSSRAMTTFLSRFIVKPTREGMADFLSGVMVDKNALDPALVGYYAEKIEGSAGSHPMKLIHSLIDGVRLRSDLLLEEETLRSVVCPTLVIHGSKDPLVPLSRVQPRFCHLDHGTVKVVEAAGHVPSLERPAEVIDAIRAFQTSERT